MVLANNSKVRLPPGPLEENPSNFAESAFLLGFSYVLKFQYFELYQEKMQ